MKKPNLLLISLLLILLASLLGGCSGRGALATSWPGLTVDQSTGYLADTSFVYAINLENGSQKWRYPVEKAEKSVFFYAPPSLTEDGQLIVGGYDHVLYSLNAENGQVLWSFTGAKDRYVASPLVFSNMIFAPNTDGFLYALDLKGNLQWTFQTEQANWAQPATDEKCQCLFLASMDHYLYAIDIEKGTQIWKSPELGGAVVANPVLDENGTIYEGTFGNEMLAIDSATGEITWRKPTTDWVWSSVALNNGSMFFGDLKGTFFNVDTSGNEGWSPIQTDGPIIGTPLVINGMVHFGTEKGTIYAYESGGNPAWSTNLSAIVLDGKPLEGKIYSPILSYGDFLLVTPSDSDVLLLALTSTGTLKWSFKPAK
jgi:eukaryotic-like serine/threonine-protein kinase